MNEIEPRKCWSQRLTHSQIIKVKKKKLNLLIKKLKILIFNLNFILNYY